MSDVIHPALLPQVLCLLQNSRSFFHRCYLRRKHRPGERPAGRFGLSAAATPLAIARGQVALGPTLLRGEGAWWHLRLGTVQELFACFLTVCSGIFFLHLSSCASQSMASALAQGFDLHLRGFAAPGGAGWTFLLLEQLQARALQPASLLHGLLPRKELLAGA